MATSVPFAAIPVATLKELEDTNSSVNQKARTTSKPQVVVYVNGEPRLYEANRSGSNIYSWSDVLAPYGEYVKLREGLSTGPRQITFAARVPIVFLHELQNASNQVNTTGKFEESIVIVSYGEGFDIAIASGSAPTDHWFGLETRETVTPA